MPVKRAYRQICGVARALDLVGERWSLLVVRELLLGPKRFTDLRDGLPGASPNALTERLTELTAAGILRRRRLPPPSASWVYELTDWGRELEPIVLALGTWALYTPPTAEQTFVSLDSLMLTIRTYYRPSTNISVEPLTIGVRIEDRNQEFGIWLDADGTVRVEHAPPERPDTVITATADDLLHALGKPREQLSQGAAKITIIGNEAGTCDLLSRVVAPRPDEIQEE
ncbi:transcriptional regulator [Microlunatus endophyticus]|uniref:Transcriptional regulator n=1 Tax=Microlunatus endophyticus TaxID=1716077 RepID=A0A917W266_9ACTN|nr:winged helix-turn-helix transcriptional regulator [Microlunatus endophyticus]GGL60513.1 transcriptional regulator [Microlunatus endophyticus]